MLALALSLSRFLTVSPELLGSLSVSLSLSLSLSHTHTHARAHTRHSHTHMSVTSTTHCTHTYRHTCPWTHPFIFSHTHTHKHTHTCAYCYTYTHIQYAPITCIHFEARVTLLNSIVWFDRHVMCSVLSGGTFQTSKVVVLLVLPTVWRAALRNWCFCFNGLPGSLLALAVALIFLEHVFWISQKLKMVWALKFEVISKNLYWDFTGFYCFRWPCLICNIKSLHVSLQREENLCWAFFELIFKSSCTFQFFGISTILWVLEIVKVLRKT